VDVGVLDDDTFIARYPSDLPNKANVSLPVPRVSIAQGIDITQGDEMLDSARKLVKEQRQIFQRVITYCTNYCKAKKSDERLPEQLFLKVNGGAGVGKTMLIQTTAQWAEKIMRTSCPDTRFPVVLKVAPTGKAASLINGLTLHSAFHLKFGNEITSIPDNQREISRNLYSHLRLLIIDEMSMVKSDMLYQVHLKLQELTQDKSLFGGISVLLLGDLMQLAPVKGSWIFLPPQAEPAFLHNKVLPLWEQFTSFQLIQNHRQGNGSSYAELLNRMRTGDHTPEDIKLLESRIIRPLPENAVHVYGTRVACANLNQSKLAILPGQEQTLTANCIHPFKGAFRPPVDSATGQIKETPFQMILSLKVDSLVMLTYNVDTADGLTNGTAGRIVEFVGTPVQQIIIDFFDEGIGANHRNQHPSLLYKYTSKNVVIIEKTKFDFSLGKAVKGSASKAKLIQFPLILAWAITAHKCQGQTILKPAKLVADLKSVFTSGMAYVICGRVQELEQLYLIDIDAKKIRANKNALEETRKMANESMLNDALTLKNVKHVKITSINVVSLAKHHPDIDCDDHLSESDILCMNETGIAGQMPLHFSRPGYKLLITGADRNKGVGMYINDRLTLVGHTLVHNSKFQMIHASFSDFDLLAVYCSPTRTNETTAQFVNDILALLTPRKQTYIMGDVNEEARDHGYIQMRLLTAGFTQFISRPTHIQGGILDHVYANRTPDLKIIKDADVYPCYFSDHASVSLTVTHPYLDTI
jgi:hypothetical protein